MRGAARRRGTEHDRRCVSGEEDHVLLVVLDEVAVVVLQVNDFAELAGFDVLDGVA